MIFGLGEILLVETTTGENCIIVSMVGKTVQFQRSKGGSIEFKLKTLSPIKI